MEFIFQIHSLINGNGRHVRFIADTFMHSRIHPVPQWPQIQLLSQGNEIRQPYITAMKKADEGDITELIQFIEGCLKETN